MPNMCQAAAGAGAVERDALDPLAIDFVERGAETAQHGVDDRRHEWRIARPISAGEMHFRRSRRGAFLLPFPTASIARATAPHTHRRT